MSTKHLLVFCAALAFTSIPAATATAAETREHEYIYGAELMTPSERDAYRAGLERATEDEARAQYRKQHRERLRKRAGARGVELDDKGLVRRREATR